MRRFLEYRTWTVLLGATLLLAAPGAHADWGIGARAGTLGLGVDISRSFTPLFNARIGVNRFTYGFDVDTNDVNYDADLELDSVHALVDFHPWAGGFRLTGGVLANDNRVEGSGTHPSGGRVDALVDFKSSAPYAGIGWGNATRGFLPVSWSIDLGLLGQGSPQVDLSNPDGLVPDSELQQEEDDLEDELSDFDVYPVISAGLVFRF